MTKSFVKRILPQSLFGRSLMIIVMPLIILQVILGGIFYENHWYKVSLRLSRDVAGDIAAVIDLVQQNPGQENYTWIFDLASDNLAMTVNFNDGAILGPEQVDLSGKMEESLQRALFEAVARPFRIYTEQIDHHVIVDVQLPDGVIRVVVNRKRLFSSTTYVFVLWMIGTSLILFAVATIFMRHQVKPIRRLSEAAD
ncbi:MAG: two-component sensor histidine kinase, partial [Rhodospirillaceae bacterium]|nr:two-component sensor histidine kinase [Rhodospirillaceae bacterium]